MWQGACHHGRALLLCTRLLTRKEAAKLVGCHPNSLLIWEEKGLLTPKRDWRGWRVYDRDDLARAMAVAAHLPLADLPEP